jgi:acetyl esterase/lipase
VIGTRYQQAWYCREFAKAGFVVMTIDYRMMPRHAFPKCLHDCKAAVRWLRRNAAEHRVDPERIVTFGASAGGHLAGLLATTRPEHGFEGEANGGESSEVKSAVCLYGAVDLRMYREQPVFGPLGRMAHDFLEDFTGRGQEAKNGDPLYAASPVAYVGPWSKPTLLVHGTADNVVHYAQSETFHQLLRRAGVPARLIAVPNKGHGFDYVFVRLRRSLFVEMLKFLDEHGVGPLVERRLAYARKLEQGRRDS